MSDDKTPEERVAWAKYYNMSKKYEAEISSNNVFLHTMMSSALMVKKIDVKSSKILIETIWDFVDTKGVYGSEDFYNGMTLTSYDETQKVKKWAHRVSVDDLEPLYYTKKNIPHVRKVHVPINRMHYKLDLENKRFVVNDNYEVLEDHRGEKYYKLKAK